LLLRAVSCCFVLFRTGKKWFNKRGRSSPETPLVVIGTREYAPASPLFSTHPGRRIFSIMTADNTQRAYSGKDSNGDRKTTWQER
jgi:hypothetical protein